MRSGESEPDSTADVAMPDGPEGTDTARVDDVLTIADLDRFEFDDVFRLGSVGSEPVDWSALIEDRSGLCVECGLPDGPRHHKKCLAHPRPPSFWWALFACFVLPLPLVLVVGPGALLFFSPLCLLGWYIRAR